MDRDEGEGGGVVLGGSLGGSLGEWVGEGSGKEGWGGGNARRRGGRLSRRGRWRFKICRGGVRQADIDARIRR